VPEIRKQVQAEHAQATHGPTMGLSDDERLEQVFKEVGGDADGCVSRADLLLKLRQDMALQRLLPLKVQDEGERHVAFERVFQALDASDAQDVSLDDFADYFYENRHKAESLAATPPSSKPRTHVVVSQPMASQPAAELPFEMAAPQPSMHAKTFEVAPSKPAASSASADVPATQPKVSLKTDVSADVSDLSANSKAKIFAMEEALIRGAVEQRPPVDLAVFPPPLRPTPKSVPPVVFPSAPVRSSPPSIVPAVPPPITSSPDIAPAVATATLPEPTPSSTVGSEVESHDTSIFLACASSDHQTAMRTLQRMMKAHVNPSSDSTTRLIQLLSQVNIEKAFKLLQHTLQMPLTSMPSSVAIVAFLRECARQRLPTKAMKKISETVGRLHQRGLVVDSATREALREAGVAMELDDTDSLPSATPAESSTSWVAVQIAEAAAAVESDASAAAAAKVAAQAKEKAATVAEKKGAVAAAQLLVAQDAARQEAEAAAKAAGMAQAEAEMAGALAAAKAKAEAEKEAALAAARALVAQDTARREAEAAAVAAAKAKVDADAEAALAAARALVEQDAAHTQSEEAAAEAVAKANAEVAMETNAISAAALEAAAAKTEAEAEARAGLAAARLVVEQDAARKQADEAARAEMDAFMSAADEPASAPMAMPQAPAQATGATDWKSNIMAFQERQVALTVSEEAAPLPVVRKASAPPSIPKVGAPPSIPKAQRAKKKFAKVPTIPKKKLAAVAAFAAAGKGPPMVPKKAGSPSTVPKKAGMPPTVPKAGGSPPKIPLGAGPAPPGKPRKPEELPQGRVSAVTRVNRQTAPKPDLTPARAEKRVEGTRYTVLRTCVLRAGGEKDSAKLGTLKKDQVIEVTERAVLADGTVRIRCAAGWTSESLGDGSVVLELLSGAPPPTSQPAAAAPAPAPQAEVAAAPSPASAPGKPGKPEELPQECVSAVTHANRQTTPQPDLAPARAEKQPAQPAASAPAVPANLQKLAPFKLRDLCKRRGLSTGGDKKAMIARLEGTEAPPEPASAPAPASTALLVSAGPVADAASSLPANLEALQPFKLKALLKERGLSQAGAKEALIQRLRVPGREPAPVRGGRTAISHCRFLPP
jgi:hypothetical protein